MTYNKAYLNEYKNLIQTTNLQKGYQEFIKLFRFLRVELEKLMPEYDFSGNIQENNMDFAYFQITHKELKSKGIKTQVVFVHKTFCFEVWASGYNRKIQCEYYEKLKAKQLPFILNDNPNRVDYILRSPLDDTLDISNGSKVCAAVKSEVLRMIEFVKKEL